MCQTEIINLLVTKRLKLTSLEIAKALNINQCSVTRSIRKLKKCGYIDSYRLPNAKTGVVWVYFHTGKVLI